MTFIHKCLFCATVWETEEQLQHHFMAMHQTKTSSLEATNAVKSKYTCCECEESCKTRKHLKSHRKTKHKEKEAFKMANEGKSSEQDELQAKNTSRESDVADLVSSKKDESSVNDNNTMSTEDLPMNKTDTDENDLHKSQADSTSTLTKFNYQCPDADCNESFKKKKHLKKHLKLNHEETQACEMKEKENISNEEITGEKTNDSGNGKAEKEASFIDENKTLSNEDIQMNKSDTVENDLHKSQADSTSNVIKFKYPCKNCSKSFNKKKYLKRHVKSDHIDIKDCELKENDEMPDQEEIPMNEETSLEKTAKKVNEEAFVTPEKEKSLMNDIDMYNDEPKLNKINEISSNVSSNKSHRSEEEGSGTLKNFESDSKYECPNCCESFKRKKLLKRHLKANHAETKAYETKENDKMSDQDEIPMNEETSLEPTGEKVIVSGNDKSFVIPLNEKSLMNDINMPSDETKTNKTDEEASNVSSNTRHKKKYLKRHLKSDQEVFAMNAKIAVNNFNCCTSKYVTLSTKHIEAYRREVELCRMAAMKCNLSECKRLKLH